VKNISCLNYTYLCSSNRIKYMRGTNFNFFYFKFDLNIFSLQIQVTTIPQMSWWWPRTPNNDISHNPLCTSFKWAIFTCLWLNDERYFICMDNTLNHVSGPLKCCDSFYFFGFPMKFTAGFYRHIWLSFCSFRDKRSWMKPYL
jgi:hypothetical protein